MYYKVFIPAAGTGSRLNSETKYLPKALVPIANKPTISYIIEKFPKEVEFVIAVGCHGDLIKQYLHLAYDDRKFTFVDVDKYEGPGSGPGYSIALCKDHLKCPFIFSCCDTIIAEQYLEPATDWFAYDERDYIEQYRTFTLDESGDIATIDEKGHPQAFKQNFPYIGLAGVNNWQAFWDAMLDGTDTARNVGEAHGLRNVMAQNKVKGLKCTWYDTGITSELEQTRARFMNKAQPNILPKENEAIWFLEDRVIKYCDNKQFISGRVARAHDLDGFIPKIKGYTDNMYSYELAEGQVMSKCSQLPVFKKLLSFSRNIWTPVAYEKEKFKDAANKFYREKTYERIDKFKSMYNNADPTVINGTEYPTIEVLLSKLNWDKISEGIPCRFHGDFHFENILWNEKEQTFKLLDWRQDFGGLTDVGDLYYDLGKMLHGLIICHELIAKNDFNATLDGNKLDFEIMRKQSLVDCERAYLKWLDVNDYDVKKVKCMTALILLNIACLHTPKEFAYILYGLGKKMLYENMII